VLRTQLDHAAQTFETWLGRDLADLRAKLRDANLPDVVP
jgi:hypothetical protein